MSTDLHQISRLIYDLSVINTKNQSEVKNLFELLESLKVKLLIVQSYRHHSSAPPASPTSKTQPDQSQSNYTTDTFTNSQSSKLQSLFNSSSSVNTTSNGNASVKQEKLGKTKAEKEDKENDVTVIDDYVEVEKDSVEAEVVVAGDDKKTRTDSKDSEVKTIDKSGKHKNGAVSAQNDNESDDKTQKSVEEASARISELKAENAILSQTLKEYESTMEVIMSKYRNQVSSMQEEQKSMRQEFQAKLKSEQNTVANLSQTNAELLSRIDDMASVMRRSLALATDEELETEMVLESYRAEVDGLRECLGLETSGDSKSKSQTRQKMKEEGTNDNQNNEEESQTKKGVAEEEENEVHHPITLRVDEDDSEGFSFDPMTVATSELDLDEDAEMEVLAGYDHSRRESTIDGKLNDSDSSRIGKRESSIDESEEVDTETKSDEVENGKEKHDGEQNEEINLEQIKEDENKGKEVEGGEEKETQEDNEELPEVSSLDDEDD